MSEQPDNVIQFPAPDPGLPANRKESPFFDGSTFLVADYCAALRAARPVMLAPDGSVAVYRDGVYRTGPLEIRRLTTAALGNLWTRTIDLEVTGYLQGVLAAEGAYLPARLPAPLLVLRNGVLDLRTGILGPHDPALGATVALDLDWRPGAACPVYDWWLWQVIPRQRDDLEECASAMLDPSRTPTRALFLFGPSRSGKSTFLRIMERIAGEANVSAVSLHALGSDPFAAANLAGKMLNVSADLSSADVEDLSAFKQLTGDDSVQANRKYGQQFKFTNRALFAFSANDIPGVSESSRAYAERIRPFHFANSYAGAERPEIERAIMGELPGILARWVGAWQRQAVRGGPAEDDHEVRQRFEEASDRVRRFAAQVLAVGPSEFATTTELHQAFKLWTSIQGGHDLGRTKFAARLAAVPGIGETRNSAGARGWTATVRHRDAWEMG